MKRTILPAILAALSSVAFAQVPNQLNYQGRVSVQGVNFTGTGQFKFALVGAAVNLNRTATAGSMAGSSVTFIFVQDGGAGYTTPPAVTIAPPVGGGSTATAVAAVGAGGIVTGVTITSGGSGYAEQPVVTIAPPPSNIVAETFWSNDLTSVAGNEPTAAVALPVSNGLYSLALGNTSLANMAMLPGNQFENRPDVRLRVWFDDGTHGFQLLTPDQPLASVPWALKAANADSANTVPDGAITAEKLADGAVASSKLAAGSVSSSKLATGAVGVDRLNITGTPGAGKVLAYGNGNNLTWATATGGGGGLSLPFNNSYSDPGSVLGLSNDNGDGLYGQTGAINKSGVVGINDVTLTIFNQSPGQGVFGYASGIGAGVLGVSEKRDGISGRTNGTGRSGVFG